MSDENYLRAQLASFTGPPGRGVTDSSASGAGRKEKAASAVESPSHYTAGTVECIQAIESAVVDLPPFEAFCIGNAIKYSWRFSKKNGIEDLEKAIWYLSKVIVERRRCKIT